MAPHPCARPVEIAPSILASDFSRLGEEVAAIEGFGGQAFLPGAVDTVRRVAEMVGDRPIEIEVDGGVTAENAAALAQAGATVLVAGSAVFKGGTTEAYGATIAGLKRATAAG